MEGRGGGRVEGRGGGRGGGGGGGEEQGKEEGGEEEKGGKDKREKSWGHRLHHYFPRQKLINCN